MGILGGVGPDWGPVGAAGGVNEAETGIGTQGPRTEAREVGGAATSRKAIQWR